MPHYICTGGCGGVSETPGACQAKDCPKHGEPLEPCDCTNEDHAAQLKGDEPTSNPA